MRVVRGVTLIVMVVVFLTGCGSAASPPPTAIAAADAAPAATSPAPTGATTELTVFAAASLTDSFGAIATSFDAANPGVQVVYSFGGSNDLAAQIVKGAPADVFASANQAQMANVVKAGLISPDAPRAFARNRLIVIYPRNNSGKVTGLASLGQPGLKVVLAAKEVPVGQYALDFLAKASTNPAYGPAYQDAVLKNVVSYEQDVKAVLNKVVLGEADAGIVYTTDVTPAAAEKVRRIEIPDALNTIATYPISTLNQSPRAVLAKKFVDYVLSNEGQATMAKFGFIPANGRASGSESLKERRATRAPVERQLTLAADQLRHVGLTPAYGARD